MWWLMWSIATVVAGWVTGILLDCCFNKEASTTNDVVYRGYEMGPYGEGPYYGCEYVDYHSQPHPANPELPSQCRTCTRFINNPPTKECLIACPKWDAFRSTGDYLVSDELVRPLSIPKRDAVPSASHCPVCLSTNLETAYGDRRRCANCGMIFT
jgi:hypothetical protein